MGGGASYFFGPNYLLENDVVLVTFNYRLGVFGFLATDDKAATGNYGLMDQIMVLKWVQKNIEKFGGDPSKVCMVFSLTVAAILSFCKYVGHSLWRRFGRGLRHPFGHVSQG